MTLRVYLDTNAVIRFIESDETDVVVLFEGAVSGLFYLCTSELTLAEALVGPYKQGKDRLVNTYEDFLVSDESLTIVPVDRNVLRLSARLRAEFGGKAPDSIHVATASLAACDILISSDRRLRLPPGMERVAVEDILQLDGGR